MRIFPRVFVPGVLALSLLRPADAAETGTAPVADAAHGKVLFQQSCVICHAVTLGAHNEVVNGQGPSLVGVLGRHAGTGTNFGYTKALSGSGLTWDAATLDRFLTVS